MKKMKCSQLGGPETCSHEFATDSWETMKNLSMLHGKEMIEKADEDHLKAMSEMKQKMQNPDEMNKWMHERKREFDSLPENN